MCRGDLMDSGEQRKFWDHYSAEWAMSAYEKDKETSLLRRDREAVARRHGGGDRQRVGASSVVELGCGRSEFAAALPRRSGCIAHSTSQSRQPHRTAVSWRRYQPSMSWILN